MATIIVLEHPSRFRGELENEWARPVNPSADANDRGQWEEKRELSGEVQVRAARNTADVLEQIGAGEKGLVVANLDVGHLEVLRLLERTDRRWPVLVVAPSEASALEWSLRELGALAVVFEPVNPSYLAALCRRALEGVAETESEIIR
ncbi:MAG: hypothetical protein QF363_21290 [Planctomycetaceae bacterium]|nr:hypothetical protein [Planctomycetaceae bacterium]